VPEFMLPDRPDESKYVWTWINLVIIT
jgi:hypothetical protein